MTIEIHARARLALLADQLIPAGDGFPSASQAGVAGAGLDLFLSFRPDLVEELKRLLTNAGNRDPASFLSELERTDPPGLAIFTELVPAAYFLNPEVRARLGYEGQTPKPIDPAEGVDEDLLRSVLGRGAIYRPTPPAAGS